MSRVLRYGKSKNSGGNTDFHVFLPLSLCPGAAASVVVPQPPPAHAASAAPATAAAALKAEMNKVDVMCVDASGGMAVRGMSYQVVQRFEHISTTTAVVPRYPTAAAAPAATATEQVGEKSIKLSTKSSK